MFVQVNAKIFNTGEQREVWFVFETDHATMKEIHGALLRDGSLVGTRYETRWRGNGLDGRVVKDAFDAIITREIIASIVEMQNELYDEDGAPVWTFDHGDVDVNGQARMPA